MSFFPSTYEGALKYSVLGHMGWSANLVAQYFIGHLQLGEKLFDGPWAVDPLMLPFAVVHAGLTFMYMKEKHGAIATYNKYGAPVFNTIVLSFSLVTDILHKFAIIPDIGNTLGITSYEHGVYSVTLLQLGVNSVLYYLLVAGEFPLMFGWVKSNDTKKSQ